MVHTLPDYTTKYKLASIYTSMDVLESAARTGSQSLLDRRGNVVWYDDFESATEKWELGGSGTGNSAAISAAQAFMGDSSMLLEAGSDTLRYASMKKYLDILPSGKYGMEFMFNLNGDTDYIELIVYVYDGTNQYRTGLYFDFTNSRIRCYDSTGNYQTFATAVPMDSTVDHWHYMKFVFDYANLRATRVTFLATTYDLTAYGFRTIGASTGKLLDFIIYHYGDVGKTPPAYIDNFIVTQNEV